MIRNPSYEGHKTALSLSDRRTQLSVSDCKSCGHAIAWATSKKSGKKYPCDVNAKQSESYGHDLDSLRAAPWTPHTKENCKKAQQYNADLRNAITGKGN